MSAARSPKSRDSLRWLSEDYAALRRKARTETYDVVIVGSGYGGAMAAMEFAGRVHDDGTPVRVCVLERGKEYAPGMFPSSLQELPSHVRVHTAKGKTVGRLDGLLDVRVGKEVCAVVGNGLGGGSLVNAGVMEAPQLRPGQLPEPLLAALTPECFGEVKRLLGASDTLHEDHPALREAPLAKTEELRRVARRGKAAFRHAAITVQTKAGDADVPQCTLCGDCMTGCNVGAKRSLDTTLLARAWALGAEVYTGGVALRLRRDGDDWLLQTAFTDASLRERHGPVEVRARKVVLAAGTLGSTEVLLRSRGSGLRLSEKLGERFSCNGDNLVAVHDGPHVVDTTGDESVGLDRRRVGPTITGMIDLDGLLLQEFAVPAPLRRLFEEVVTTSSLLHRLADWPRRTATQKAQGLDAMAVDPHAMRHTLLVGLIGHDDSQWKLVLPRPPRWRRADRPREGELRIEWAAGGKRHDVPRMEQDFRRARALLEAAAAGGTVLPNPLWRLLPEDMEFLVQGSRGPVLTVHPLGGCAMGRSHADGVVDHLGRVFRRPHDGEPAGVHEGLVVLDGSILPGSLGANPALTIAAIARNAARELAKHWHWSPAGSRPREPGPRPVYRPSSACTPPPPVPTTVQLIERLAGPAGRYWIELTLRFRDEPVSHLASHATRRLDVAPGDSSIRVYDGRDARTRLLLLKEAERDDAALFKAPLSGTLTIADPALGLMNVVHMVRAGVAWFGNRGLREIADWQSGAAPNVTWRRFPHSAMRAGQQRRFTYALTTGTPEKDAPADAGLAIPPGTALHATKCITYGRRSNPWRQLTELHLDTFPGVAGRPVLKLDGRFLAGRGVPLMRIRQQQNQVAGLVDMASLGLAWLRMLASIHLWSFRAPDTPTPRRPNRLPGPIATLPPPQRKWLAPDDHAPRVKALLTRYPQPGSGKPPIVLIHGYSASGNTFTHRAIPRPLARHLWEDGRDVWVLDLRTSAGLKTALRPWHFEDAALADIPVALAHVREATGQPADVFAHCIGGVMLSMGLLADEETLERLERVDIKPHGQRPQRRRRELAALPGNIRRIVLSQKGPLVVYSDENVLRAYFLRLLRRLLLPDGYQFRAPRRQGVTANLMDRVLSTMAYPDDEFDRENPFSWSRRARWAGFRHRMDALYARDFSLRNIREETLEAIEDLFGPLNLDTVAQGIHFARKNAITDAGGLPFTANRAALAARWPRAGTLSIHGEENGLTDVKSLEMLKASMDYAGIRFEARSIPGHGHQDCLIGERAPVEVFPWITRFLDER